MSQGHMEATQVQSIFNTSPIHPMCILWLASLIHCSQSLWYLEELWRKKQSDVMRFLQRVRTWEFLVRTISLLATKFREPNLGPIQAIFN